jgi:Family of unknown function (DUF6183)
VRQARFTIAWDLCHGMTAMSDEIGGLLAAFNAATGLADRRVAVEQAAARGQGLMLYELASALARHIDDSAIPRRPYSGFLEHVSRVLALTPGSANAEWAVRLATGTHHRSQLAPPPRRIRRAAGLLAAGQPAECLTPLFTAWPAESGPELDFLGCLAQEMVLRHGEVSDPGALDVASRLRAAGHPLAVLPLFLLDPERQLTLPSHHYRGHSAGLPYGPYQPSAPPGGTAHPLPVPAGDVTDVSASQLTRTAVDGWVTHSRGKAEARVFRFHPPIDPATLAAASLAALPLQALAGEPAPWIAERQATAAGVFRILFAAASRGGAYGEGLGGAHGRPAAWQSLAELTGQADPRPRRCRRRGHRRQRDPVPHLQRQIPLVPASRMGHRNRGPPARQPHPGDPGSHRHRLSKTPQASPSCCLLPRESARVAGWSTLRGSEGFTPTAGMSRTDPQAWTSDRYPRWIVGA